MVARYVKTKKALYFFVWTFVSILYWFLTAPDLRFGDGFFWVWPGTAFLFLLPGAPRFALSDLWKNPKIRITFFYFWGICGICIAGISLFLLNKNLLTIGELPSRPVIEYTVNADHPFTVWIPKEGDKTGNSPLPSTPYKPTNLEMREPGNLSKGFRPIRR